MSCGSLRDLDLVLHAGERVAVVAAAGGGERVLAEVLVGVRQPDRGRVRRSGRDVTAPRRERGAQRTPPAVGVAWLSPTPRPFGHLTVYENVLVAAMAARRRRRVSEAHARRALERTGLIGRADDLPGGLDRGDLHGSTPPAPSPPPGTWWWSSRTATRRRGHVRPARGRPRRRRPAGRRTGLAGPDATSSPTTSSGWSCSGTDGSWPTLPRRRSRAVGSWAVGARPRRRSPPELGRPGTSAADDGLRCERAVGCRTPPGAGRRPPARGPASLGHPGWRPRPCSRSQRGGCHRRRPRPLAVLDLALDGGEIVGARRRRAGIRRHRAGAAQPGRPGRGRGPPLAAGPGADRGLGRGPGPRRPRLRAAGGRRWSSA